jgi:hypothetical protein
VMAVGLIDRMPYAMRRTGIRDANRSGMASAGIGLPK